MSKQQPAQPQAAASIILLRERINDLELLMIVRHQQMKFASGALVFPGGKADPDDDDPLLAEHLSGAAESAELRQLQVAAIREAFEECGILLARANHESELIGGDRLQALASYRAALHAGELPIREFLEREQLQLACDQLVYFAHWLTPGFMPKRFDTHFFLAPAPTGQQATHDGTESTRSVWLAPHKALAEASDGKLKMMFPTRCIIDKLNRFTTIPTAIDAARTDTVVQVMPWKEQRSDGTYLCISSTAGYPISEEKIDPGG